MVGVVICIGWFHFHFRNLNGQIGRSFGIFFVWFAPDSLLPYFLDVFVNLAFHRGLA